MVSGDIPLKLLKESNFSFEKLRNCTDYAFCPGKFPDSPNTENKQSRGKEFHIIMNIPKHSMSIILKWFKVNSLKANPGKIMILGNHQQNLFL